jgi:hypothetical protein
MDLNKLFYFQQIERSRAEAAASDEARDIHERPPSDYAKQIAAFRSGTQKRTRWSIPPLPATSPKTKVNATMAIVITARELAQ